MLPDSRPLLTFPLFAGLSPAHQTVIAGMGRTVELVKRQRCSPRTRQPQAAG
jgi:hypothetical protein